MFEKSFDPAHQNPNASHPPHRICSCGPRQVMSNRTPDKCMDNQSEKLKQVFQNPDGRHNLRQSQRSCPCNSHLRSTHQQCETQRWPPWPFQKCAFLSHDRNTMIRIHTLIQPLSIEVLWCHTHIPSNRIQVQIQPLSSHTGGRQVTCNIGRQQRSGLNMTFLRTPPSIADKYRKLINSMSSNT